MEVVEASLNEQGLDLAGLILSVQIDLLWLVG
jgi:hypothetical protein